MMRTALAALALAAATTFALAATDEELRERIVGPWGKDAGCAQGALTFNADGTFALVRPGNDPATGTWQIAEGVLTGTGQPASTVAIEGATLSLGDPEGGGGLETFTRCPE